MFYHQIALYLQFHGGADGCPGGGGEPEADPGAGGAGGGVQLRPGHADGRPGPPGPEPGD